MINVHNSANRDFLPFLRRIYHIVSFYLFFFNVVLGLFSCLRRILMSLVFGLMLISRLDRCLLMRGFERFDAGTFQVKYQDCSEQLLTTLISDPFHSVLFLLSKSIPITLLLKKTESLWDYPYFLQDFPILQDFKNHVKSCKYLL